MNKKTSLNNAIKKVKNKKKINPSLQAFLNKKNKKINNKKKMS